LRKFNPTIFSIKWWTVCVARNAVLGHLVNHVTIPTTVLQQESSRAATDKKCIYASIRDLNIFSPTVDA